MKWWASFLSIGLAVGILAPLDPGLRGRRGDSFPFSWYPMFSRPRPAEEKVDYVVGLDHRGRRFIIHSRHYVRGSMNQARRQITRLAKRPETARAVCEDLADKAVTKGGILGHMVRG